MFNYSVPGRDTTLQTQVAAPPGQSIIKAECAAAVCSKITSSNLAALLREKCSQSLVNPVIACNCGIEYLTTGLPPTTSLGFQLALLPPDSSFSR